MWLKIKVLLWKSLQLRKRHWLSTIIEIIIPCLLFYFMCYFKSLGESSQKYIDEIVPSPVPEKDLHQYFINSFSNGHFIYTPQTLETDQIMKIVGYNLNILSSNIETAKNEAEMIEKFKNKLNNSDFLTNSNGFGIVFEETTKSHGFKYKIRSTDDIWQTNRLFPSLEIPGPMDSGEIYLKKGFLSLQLTLDKAFISLSSFSHNSPNISDYNFEIQSYPFANFIIDLGFEQLFHLLFPSFTVSSFLLMCSYTIKRVAEEKESGVKELMKMMGLKSWMIWTGWILHNLFIYAISITIITYLTCFEIFHGKEKLLNYTNPFLLWIFLVTYLVTGTFFCFAISSMFNKPLVALIVGSMAWCLSYSVPLNILKPSTSIQIKTLFMLLPNVAVTNAYSAISALETQGKGLQFSTLFTIGKGDSNFSVGFVLFMFIVDCFLYGFIAWYLDSVMPGEYGIAKPFNFLCKFSKNKTENNVMVSINKSNSKFFEKPPNEYEVGISVQNLHKRFGNFYAVNGVNLDLYKGQITALLGHNGAGKTTTMSIITGIIFDKLKMMQILY